MAHIQNSAFVMLALLIAASAYAPSAVGTLTQAGGSQAGGWTIAAYQDDTTGNVAKLVAKTTGLYCQWDAPYAGTSTDFLPSYYFSGCSLSGASGDWRVGSDRGSAAGFAKLSNSIPSPGEYTWTPWVSAADVRMETTSGTTSTEHNIDNWYVDAAGAYSFTGKVHILPPSASGETTISLSLAGGYSAATETTVEVSSSTHMSYKSAKTLDGTFDISIAPGIQTILLTGAPVGCDALNLLESIFGPRETGPYNLRYEAYGNGEHTATAAIPTSKIWSVQNYGQWTSQYVVTADHSVSGGPKTGSAFATDLGFTVDYEYPEPGSETGAVLAPPFWMLLASDQNVALTTEPHSSQLLVTHSTSSALDYEVIASTFNATQSSGTITGSEVAGAGSLANALAGEIGMPFTAAARTAPNGCGAAAVPKDLQDWTAVGTMTAGNALIDTQNSPDLRVLVGLDLTWNGA